MQLVKNIFLLFALILAASSSPLSEVSSGASRIVNGNIVDIREVPYQAALQRRVAAGWTHHCGAVVVSIRILLSASHCTISYSPTSLRIMVGVSSRQDTGTVYEISEIVNHEQYDPSTLENDISMLITSANIVFSDSVRAVAIAPWNMQLQDGVEATVSGFGAIQSDGPVSTNLLAAQVRIVNQEMCSVAYRQIGTIFDGMLCAAGVNPSRDACQGDSGGPLVSNNILIGIVSWGEGCAHEVYPGVYARVSAYQPWIMTNSGRVTAK